MQRHSGGTVEERRDEEPGGERYEIKEDNKKR
jgi:hypothetical protein